MPMAATTPNNNNNTGNNNNNAAATPNASNKTWELSDYELHRTPQEALDNAEIAVSPRALQSELMCPICLDMLDNTMTTKECLHRFCAQCIITALRSGNKECPTCRKKLVSKRSLRPDPNFDALISRIYPSREEYEQQQQKAMQKLSKSHNQLALASSVEEGIKAQSQLRKVPTKGSKVNITNSNSGNEESSGVGGGGGESGSNNNMANGPNQVNSSHPPSGNVPPIPSASGPRPAKIRRTDSAENSSNSSGYSEEVTEVELVFKPHPEMVNSHASNAAQTQIRYIKTTANASVEHLAKYLGMRLALDSQVEGTDSTPPLHNCTIYVQVSENVENPSFATIPQNQTLSQVCEKFWKINKPLEMYYSWRQV